jgi:putative inorganic carbon (HCO3(-)) transporter
MIFPSSAAGGNRFWQIAILLFFLIIFLDISRILDPVKTHIIPILLVLLAISLLASRRALIFWKSEAGKVLPFFVVWILLAYFMAPHTDLSYLYLLGILQGTLLFLAATGLLAAVSDSKKFFTLLAGAALVLCVLGIVWSGVRDGRFALRGGYYGDPNYYAMGLLALAPILWVSVASKPLWLRLCGLFATAFPVLLALRTASRGGFVALFAMLIVIFFLASVKTRILIASASVLTLVVLLAFMPASLRTRLESAARISSVDAANQPTVESVSAGARQTLLMTSINLTLENPVLGVGPGNFGPTIAEVGRLQGYNWLNLNTHNSYTQVSSETGFPGLLLYLLLIFFSVKSVLTVIRRTSPRGTLPDPELHRMGAGLLVSLAATCTCMFFLSEGYSSLVLFWFGVASGLRLLLPEDPRDEEEELVEMQPDQVT